MDRCFANNEYEIAKSIKFDRFHITERAIADGVFSALPIQLNIPKS